MSPMSSRTKARLHAGVAMLAIMFRATASRRLEARLI